MKPTYFLILDALLKRCLTTGLLGLAVCGGGAFAQADKLTPELTGKPRERVILADRIIAVVNDEVITMRELEERVRIVTGQLKRQDISLPPPDVLQTQVLERVIIDRAQMLFSRENGIRIDDVQLDRAVARIAEENRMTLVQFRDTLEKDGVPFNRFREDIRVEILINRLRQSEIDGKVVISEGEIDNFLAQNKPSDTAQELNLGHILVRVPENASPEQIEARRKRAMEALAQIKSGTDFARVAVSFSEAPEALTGGALGFRKQENLPQLFVDAIAGLAKGGVSDLVKSANGFHILKLIDQRGAGSAPVVKQTRVRHILIRPSELVSQDQARRRLLDLRERIINKAATFEELARQNSADGSASKGGDLGVVFPGDTVPEFERAMDELKIGEVGQPVQTQFGWHLLEVTERSNAELSTERQRKIARDALRERKVDEAYQEWLRQLRDRTFVEYRLEDR